MVAHTVCRPHSKYGRQIRPANMAGQIRPPAPGQGWECPRLLTLGSTNLKRSASTATRPQVVVACARAGRAGEDFTDLGTPSARRRPSLHRQVGLYAAAAFTVVVLVAAIATRAAPPGAAAAGAAAGLHVRARRETGTTSSAGVLANITASKIGAANKGHKTVAPKGAVPPYRTAPGGTPPATSHKSTPPSSTPSSTRIAARHRARHRTTQARRPRLGHQHTRGCPTPSLTCSSTSTPATSCSAITKGCACRPRA